MMLLLNPPPQPEPKKKEIGFHVKDKMASYRAIQREKGRKKAQKGK